MSSFFKHTLNKIGHCAFFYSLLILPSLHGLQSGLAVIVPALYSSKSEVVSLLKNQKKQNIAISDFKKTLRLQKKPSLSPSFPVVKKRWFSGQANNINFFNTIYQNPQQCKIQNKNALEHNTISIIQEEKLLLHLFNNINETTIQAFSDQKKPQEIALFVQAIKEDKSDGDDFIADFTQNVVIPQNHTELNRKKLLLLHELKLINLEEDTYTNIEQNYELACPICSSIFRAYPKIPDILKSLIEQAKLRKAEAASKLLFQQFFMPRDQDKIPKVRSTTHL